MGVISDLIANATTFKSVGRESHELEKLAEKGDPVSIAAGAVANAVHTVNQYASNPSAGTFTLTVTLRNGETFTTAGIAYNAAAAAIETAIDTAASGTVTGWTNGDISVTGGALTVADVVLTFDGSSVAGAIHQLTTLDGAGLTGGTLASPATEITTAGQSARYSWSVLVGLGVVAAPIPEQTDAFPVVVAGPNHLHIKPEIVRQLAQEAAAEDDNAAMVNAICDAIMGQEHRKVPIS